MKQKYDMDSLIKIFEKHAADAEIGRLKHLETVPDSEWAKCDFHVARALYHICIEIKKINEKLKD